MARRLIEAGVRFVTVNTFLTVFDEITWDIHGTKPFTSIEGMRDIVAPMYDQAYSALIEDLNQRGMLDNTLVCNLAEFGRTPRVNPAGGRDHWPQCWTGLLCRRRRAGGPRRRSQRCDRRISGRAARRAERSRGHDLPQPRTGFGNDNCRARPAARLLWSIRARSRSPNCFDPAWHPRCRTVRRQSAERRRRSMIRASFPRSKAISSPLGEDSSQACLFAAGSWSDRLDRRVRPHVAASPLPARRLAILPHKIVAARTEGPAGNRRRAQEKGRLVGQATEGVVFESSDPKVVRVSNSVAIPVGDGKATIPARWKGRTAQIEVTVENQKVDEPWSFRNHVQAVLTKAGCNSGACHGAAAGKNGFKLSLRGYDPAADFLAITRQARRATNRAERSRTQPGPVEAVGRDPAQRGPAVQSRLARISRAGRMDRRRSAGARRRAIRGSSGSKFFPKTSCSRRATSSRCWSWPTSPTVIPKTSRPGPSSLRPI